MNEQPDLTTQPSETFYSNLNFAEGTPSKFGLYKYRSIVSGVEFFVHESNNKTKRMEQNMHDRALKFKQITQLIDEYNQREDVRNRDIMFGIVATVFNRDSSIQPLESFHTALDFNEHARANIVENVLLNEQKVFVNKHRFLYPQKYSEYSEQINNLIE